MKSTTNLQPPTADEHPALNADAVIAELLSLTSDKQLQDLIIANKVFFEKALLAREIEWIDFYSNYLEFDGIRDRNQEIKEAKTKYVEFNIAELQEYLTNLAKLKYTNVEVYIGKYRNAPKQPSGDPIPTSHEKRITVMFAAAGTVFTFMDPPKPFNVGDPHP